MLTPKSNVVDLRPGPGRDRASPAPAGAVAARAAGAARAHPITVLRPMVSSAPPVPSRPARVAACFDCRLWSLCPAVADAGACAAPRLERRRVAGGEVLHREGDPFIFISAVRTGSFKSAVALPDGREQVCSFHLTGDVMALDGIADGRHASTATALEDAQVCSIAYGSVVALTAGSAGLQRAVNRSLGYEFGRGQRLMLALGSMNAPERLAAFVLDLSQRHQARGCSAREFHLRMTRAEIGSYLGMTLETVSRTFSAFKQQHFIDVDNRHVRITDLEGFAHAYEALLGP